MIDDPGPTPKRGWRESLRFVGMHEALMRGALGFAAMLFTAWFFGVPGQLLLWFSCAIFGLGVGSAHLVFALSGLVRGRYSGPMQVSWRDGIGLFAINVVGHLAASLSLIWMATYIILPAIFDSIAATSSIFIFP